MHDPEAPPPERIKMLDTPDPMTQCPADHRSISTALLINDGGLEWRKCPYCHVMVEPGIRDGNIVGVPWGPGRGDLTIRLQARLKAWAGWVKFNGGDE